MTKLYIVRHGKTDWNNLKIIQGKTDIELNEEGISEAKKLAQNINLDEIDICFSSPLKRAKETAKILTQNKVEIVYDDLLLERGFGEYEGKKITQELAVKHWNLSLNDKSNGVESIKELLSRSDKFLAKIKKEYPNKTILIVSHGCIIKCLHFSIQGYNENTDFLTFVPKNTTLYTYEI